MKKTAPPHGSYRTWLIFACMLGGWSFASDFTSSHGAALLAQEREARWRAIEALAELEAASAKTSEWKAWLDAGELTTWLRAFDAGKLTDPTTIKPRIDQLPEKGTNRGRAAREALTAWLAILDIPALPPTTPQAPQTAANLAVQPAESITSLNAKLARITDEFRFGAAADHPWRERLRFASIEKLLAGQTVPETELEAIETNWLLARPTWDSLSFRRLLASIQRLVVAARRTAMTDREEQIRAALATLNDATQSAAHPAAIHRLDSIDEAADRSIPWHTARRHPHFSIRLQIPEPEPQEIDETYRVSGVYAGTRVSGSGQFTGQLFIDWTEQTMVPTLQLRLEGESSSRTVGRRNSVTVRSSSNSTVRGTKSIEWTELGFRGLEPTASASARVNFDSIDASSIRSRYRGSAINEVYASRSAAIRDTRRAVEKSSRERLNQQANQLIDQANRWIDRDYRQPLLEQTRYAPRAITSRHDEILAWDCWYGAPEEPGVTNVPPDMPKAPWTVLIHEDFLTRYFLTRFPSTFTTDSLSRIFPSHSNQPPNDNPTEAPQNLETSDVLQPNQTFTLDPVAGCEVRIQENSLTFTLRVLKFISEDNASSTPFSIQASYQPQLAQRTIILQRQADPIVTILSGAGTARALNLKRILNRQCQTWFAQQIELNPQDWSLDQALLPQPVVTQLDMTPGWLVLSGEFETE